MRNEKKKMKILNHYPRSLARDPEKGTGQKLTLQREATCVSDERTAKSD